MMAASWPARIVSRSAGSDANAGHRALAQDPRLAEDPVEERPFELRQRSRQASERARRVDPDEGLRMQEERLEDLQRPPDELGIGLGGIPRTVTSRQRAARTRPRSVPCAGPRIIASNVVGGPPEPLPEVRDLERARPRLPDQDLEPRARFDVVG